MISTILDGSHALVAQWPLLLLAAKRAAAVSETSGGKSDGRSWAIVLFCVILGLLVSLNPSRRTYEIKRTKEE